MNDFVASLIRTYVPIGVGAVISFLVTLGVELDANAQAALVTFGTALLTGVYYTVIRALEQRFPNIGVLLGTRKTPTYDNGKVIDGDDSTADEADIEYEAIDGESDEDIAITDTKE